MTPAHQTWDSTSGQPLEDGIDAKIQPTGMTPAHQWTHHGDKVLIVKNTWPEGEAHDDFRWPESGIVTAPDWNPEPRCGGGLHGWPWGVCIGYGKDPEYGGRWYVLAAQPEDVVVVGTAEKVKAREVEIVLCGTFHDAMQYTLAGRVAWSEQAGADASKGDCSKLASAGDWWTHASMWDKCTHSSGGNKNAHASSGVRSTHSSGGTRSVHSSCGYGSAHSSSGYGSGHASSGFRSVHLSSGDQDTHASSGDHSTHNSRGLRSTHCSGGYYSTHESNGDHSAHSSGGVRSTHSSIGTRSSHASSGDWSAHTSSGDWSSCATSGEGCTIDIAKGIGAASARKIRWVPRKEAALVQWWRDGNDVAHTNLFLSDGLEEGIPVLIEDGQIVQEWK